MSASYHVFFPTVYRQPVFPSRQGLDNFDGGNVHDDGAVNANEAVGFELFGHGREGLVHEIGIRPVL